MFAFYFSFGFLQLYLSFLLFLIPIILYLHFYSLLLPSIFISLFIYSNSAYSNFLLFLFFFFSTTSFSLFVLSSLLLVLFLFFFPFLLLYLFSSCSSPLLSTHSLQTPFLPSVVSHLSSLRPPIPPMLRISLIFLSLYSSSILNIFSYI